MNLRGRDQDAYDAVQRALEIPMMVLALAFVPIAVVPVITDVSARVATALETAAWVIWAAFVAEYLALLWTAPDRGRMVRTHILDLVIIVLPFLRPLRAFRVLRLLRAVSGLARAGTALRRVTARPGFRGFLVVVVAVLIACAGLVYVFERSHPDASIRTPADALWWAIVTATTVGYGDYFPVTPEGRGVGVLLMLLGISLLSVVTANIAAFFVEHSAGADESDDDIRQRLDRIEQLLRDHAAEEVRDGS